MLRFREKFYSHSPLNFYFQRYISNYASENNTSSGTIIMKTSNKLQMDPWPSGKALSLGSKGPKSVVKIAKPVVKIAKSVVKIAKPVVKIGHHCQFLKPGFHCAITERDNIKTF